MRFGDWEDATALALATLDAALGRRILIDFDPSIETLTSFVAIPVLPFSAIDELAQQLCARIDENPSLQPCFDSLKARCEDYVLQVIETREERQLLAS